MDLNPRISALSPLIVHWVLARARAMPGGRPAFTYARIAANLKRRRGVVLSAKTVQRLVAREDQELARRRAAAWGYSRQVMEEGPDVL